MPHHRVVIVGGGNAGLTVAGRLQRAGVRDIAVIEPRGTHVFSPLQSHIAGGVARRHEAERPQAEAMPPGVHWLRDAVRDIDPDARTVRLASGSELAYDHLVVCPGIAMDWDAVPGLADAMASPYGGSNYDLELAVKVSPLLRDLRSGTVVFTQASDAASCPAAAQKPMYLACAWWRAQGVLDDIRVVFATPEATLFGNAAIDGELARKVAEYGIEVRYETDLLTVDADARQVELGRGDARETIAYDLLHVSPPVSAPDWLAATPLADASDPGGFVEIDPETLRHVRYPEVWSLGDAAAIGTLRSGGGLRSQGKILVQNLTAAMAGREPTGRYDGYTVCPFTVSRRTVVFAEVDRVGRLKPTVPFWKTLFRERRLAWLFDRRILPWVYWHLILRGRA